MIKVVRKRFWSYLCGIMLLSIVLCMYGCGSSTSDDSDWGNGNNIVRVSNLKGRVILPVEGLSDYRAQTMEGRFSLTSALGTKVFVEDRPDLFATCDANGDFLIANVPAGYHRLVASVLAGTSNYRQRTDSFSVSGDLETQVLINSIPLEYAPYSVTIHLADLKTNSPISGSVTMWGYVYPAINGEVTIGPFPGGMTAKEGLVTSVGYRDSRALITFGDTNKSEIYIKMTPLTSADANQSPIVEIQQSSLQVKTNERINLNALGFDPEGDAITWKWAAERGSFFNDFVQQTTYTAPSTSGRVRISLTGTDSKGASGLAILDLDIIQGSSREYDPKNIAPDKPNKQKPEHMEIDLGEEIVLSWECSDPNNEALTYVVNFGKQGSELKTIANNISENSLTVKGLEANTWYYWQVTAYDEHNASTDSDLWQFKTGNLGNQPPNVPTLPKPADFEGNIADFVSFSWSGGDPDGDPVTYSIYLATASTWIKSEPTQLTKIHSTNLLKYDYYGLAKGATYQWQVVARDSHGMEAKGPVWTFYTVEPENNMPSFASIVEPADGSTGIGLDQTLRWVATDIDDDTLYYDVYFGTDENPELVSASQTSQIYTPDRLVASTTYYWRIVVTDGRATNPRSDIWSFTTAPIIIENPAIVSITEPDSITSPLKVVFNKYIDKSNQVAAFKFNPFIEGTWTWKEDNTIAEFKPVSGSWYPGSYNKFSIVKNILKDADGNLLEEGTEKAFTLPSDVEVPSGYHSYGFPITVAKNTTLNIKVPDLEYGKNSYVVAIAKENSTSGTVSSMRASAMGPLDSVQSASDPTYALRMRECETISRPIQEPNKLTRASLSSVNAASLGEVRNFYLDAIATTTPYPRNVFSATLAKMSGNAIVYLDDAIVDSNRENFAAQVLSTFENNVLDKVRENFGNEPNVGVDGESRVSIVLLNGNGITDGLAGYYSPVDLYLRDSESATYRSSNEGKIIYIKYGMADTTTFGTLAHEFQHMINYYHKNKMLNYDATKLYEETWLNEALAKYSEEVCGFSILDGDANTADLMRLSMNSNSSLSLTYWGPDTTYCYGQVYMFMHFLAYPGRYRSSSKEVTRALVESNGLIGESNVEAVTGEPFEETIAKFALSVTLNRYYSDKPNDYCLHGIDLSGRYNGINLPGYKIENVTSSFSLTGMRKNAFRIFRKASTGNGDTTITVTTGSHPITLWCFDERE